MAKSEHIFRDRHPIALVDIETTGGLADVHRITEIAVVGMRGADVEFEWQTLVNPGVRIPGYITALTGIDNAMVRDAPGFAGVAASLRERLAGRIFLAHNVRFDYRFICGEFQRLGERWQAPVACTARLSRKLYPAQRRHNLDSVIAAHAFECRARHRAMGDADVLRQLWQRIHGEFALEQLDQVLQQIMQRPQLPPQLDAELVDRLPVSHGVYRFHGTEDALIYAGKANNLRERVLSHFSGSHRDGKSSRLAAQVRRIEWTETAGELGALLREADLVRRSKPVYNRQLRGGGESVAWLFPESATKPTLVALDWTTRQNRDVYGPYRGARDARKALIAIAGEQQLCLKTLGIEQGLGPCFAAQLGRCKGACDGGEAPALHALRARLAMARWRLATWPFKGPIAVLEVAAAGWAEALVLIDWQYLGSVRLDEGEGAISTADLRERCRGLLVASLADGAFDRDTYRILCRFLARNRQQLTLVDLATGDRPGEFET